MKEVLLLVALSLALFMIFHSIGSLFRLIRLRGKIEAISCKKFARLSANIQRDRAGLPIKYGEDSFLALERDLKIIDSLLKNRKTPV